MSTQSCKHPLGAAGHGRMTMRQSQAETRRQNVAKRSMTKEVKQLTGLIATLRDSLESIHKQRANAKLFRRRDGSSRRTAQQSAAYDRGPGRSPVGGAGADRSRPSAHHPRPLAEFGGGAIGSVADVTGRPPAAERGTRSIRSPGCGCAGAMLPADGTKLPRSRRIAAKARCHEEAGAGATQGDTHWPTK
ncbi:hypothetical protein ACVI3S_004440 [Bradyrhizobium diazoefficiens]